MIGKQYIIKRLGELISTGEIVLSGYNKKGNIDQHDRWVTEVRSFLKVNGPNYLELLNSVTQKNIEGDRLLKEPFGRAAYEMIQGQIEVLRLMKGNFEVAEDETVADSREIDMISILFLAADPTNASRLRLGEEFREINQKLSLAKQRDRFRLELPQLSVRSEDISQALLNTQPQIVHFSGHGTPDGALCFEDKTGNAHFVEPIAAAALFEQFVHHVKCVILNACFSEVQAKAIARHVNYVVGMNQSIGDEAAVAFAVGFYQALGAGRTIEEAYRLGCVQVGLRKVSESLTPVLYKKE